MCARFVYVLFNALGLEHLADIEVVGQRHGERNGLLDALGAGVRVRIVEAIAHCVGGKSHGVAEQVFGVDGCRPFAVGERFLDAGV